jgi:hypothetical protein
MLSSEESQRTGPSDGPANLPDQPRLFWVVVGWSVLYSALKWLRTDGSDQSIKMFDDSSWPDAVLIGWPVVYWTVSGALLAL